MGLGNPIIAIAFLLITGIGFAQDDPGRAVTDSGSAEANSGTALKTNSSPGSIQRRDVPGERSGVVNYMISVSQSFESGVAPGEPETSGVSGTLHYTYDSGRNEFGTMYSGGGLWSGQDRTSDTTFQNFELRDALRFRRLTLMVSDDVSYLPQSPTVGSSGIPGMGDLNGAVGFGTLTQSIVPNQTIFSENSQRVSNAAAGSTTFNVTGRTSITTMGSYGILRFVDTNALDSQQDVAGLTISHRFSGRNTVGVRYTFERFGYDAPPATFNANGVSLTSGRRWSRRWRSDFEVGPQWVSQGSISLTSLNVAGSASINYSLNSATALDIEYSRGVTGGSGVLEGSRADSASLAATRWLGRSWSASITGTYSRNVGLLQDQLFVSKCAGAQLSHMIGRFSGYFSYTAIHQSSSVTTSPTPVNLLQGLYNTFSFGIQFTSRRLRVRGI